MRSIEFAVAQCTSQRIVFCHERPEAAWLLTVACDNHNIHHHLLLQPITKDIYGYREFTSSIHKRFTKPEAGNSLNLKLGALEI